MSIYLKLDKEPKTIRELLLALFSYNNYDEDDEYDEEDIIFKSVATYSDKECLVIETYEDKYRSVDDVVTIVNTYFPEASEKEIIREIIGLVIFNNNNYYLLTPICCDQIYKPTIYYRWSEEIDETWYITGCLDSVRLNNSKYKTWNKVFKLAGFSDGQEVYKFIMDRLGEEEKKYYTESTLSAIDKHRSLK